MTLGISVVGLDQGSIIRKGTHGKAEPFTLWPGDRERKWTASLSPLWGYTSVIEGHLPSSLYLQRVSLASSSVTLGNRSLVHGPMGDIQNLNYSRPSTDPFLDNDYGVLTEKVLAFSKLSL